MSDFLDNGQMTNFPDDLYDLPVFMTLSDAQERIAKASVSRPKKVRTVTVTVRLSKLKVTPPMATAPINATVNRGLFTQMNKAYDITGLTEKFGAQLVTDARNLTAQEFVDLFGL